jgi:ParB family chromosome partitioning protein
MGYRMNETNNDKSSFRNADKVSPESLVVIGIDYVEGPLIDLVDHRVFGVKDENLIRDIFDKGVLQTVLCRKMENGKLEVIDGRRRVLHAREANKLRAKTGSPLVKVPVNVIQADDVKALELQISLNTNRKEEDPITLSKKISTLIAMLADSPETIRRVAVASNMSEASVRNYQRLARMDESIHDKIRSGKLGVSAALTLSAESPDIQNKIADKLIETGSGKDAAKAREVRNAEVPPDRTARGPGRPRKETTAPSRSLIKDILMLIAFDKRAENMSWEDIPEDLEAILKWVVGEGSADDVSGLANLVDRALGNEAKREKKNAKFDE